ncbi:MAG: hypothetical protein LBS00_10430, partial [Synergistaceae bacterium]|nr:hypothetical protein [Synergistaceae bacterium]
AVAAKNGEFVATTEKLISDICAMLGELSGQRIGRVRKEIKPKPDEALLRDLLGACEHFDVANMEKKLSEMERFSYESRGDLVEWLRLKTNNLEYDEIRSRLHDILAEY